MRTSTAVIAASLALAGTASAGTKFTSTWANPEATAVSLWGKKVVALVISKDEATRRGSEDELARDLNRRGGHGVSAYSLLPPTGGAAPDREVAKAAFDKAGAAAVAVLRVLGSQQEFTSSGGGWYATPTYGSFWGGYWSTGWSAAYTSGQTTTETVVSIETLVYSLEQDKLLWAGRSETKNPKRVDSIIKDLANKAAKEMKKAAKIQH